MSGWLATTLVLAFATAGGEPDAAAPCLSVGSKAFAESGILAELLRVVVEREGCTMQHRAALGGTSILWAALEAGELDVYPEYTGTLREELLKDEQLASDAALARALERRGLGMSTPLGFNNSYALVMRADQARRLGVQSISQLARAPSIVVGLSNELLARADGWPALSRRYRLEALRPRGLDHSLAYRALIDGSLDVTDAYTTDAELVGAPVVLLEDDLGHFPRYDAVFVYRKDRARQHPELERALARLGGTLDETTMQRLNAERVRDRRDATLVARAFATEKLGLASTQTEEARVHRIFRHVREHVVLVVASLVAALALGLPLGFIASRWVRARGVVLAVAGVAQTIPSMALLVMLIPLLGIGTAPALAALAFYGVLPILEGVVLGLGSIPKSTIESALVLGLSPRARLWAIELPLASPAILSGVRTAAVINVGTATVGALIGAGGLGQPILTGIRLNDVGLVLEGAIPAALLALVTQGLFAWATRTVVPRGLRLASRDDGSTRA